MGLMDFLSPALNVATQAAGSYQGAQSQVEQGKREAMLQSLMMARQQHEQAIKDAQAAAQTSMTNAHTSLYQRQTTKPQEDDPGYVDLMAPIWGAQAGAKADAEIPLIDRRGAIQRAVAGENNATRIKIAGMPARPSANGGSGGGSGTTSSGAEDKYVTGRMPKLTAPRKNVLMGTEVPGLSPEAAAAQARTEYRAAHGGSVAPTPNTPNPGQTGNVTLKDPQAPTTAPASGQGNASGAEFAALGAKYKQALAAGIDPALAREAYNTDVTATVKKYGLK